MEKSAKDLSDKEIVVLFLTGKITTKKIDGVWHPFIGGYQMAERFAAVNRKDAVLLATQYQENVSLEILRAIANCADII